MKTLIKIFSISAIAFAIAFATSSCEEQDNSYSGPLLVEFQKSINGVSESYTAGAGVSIDTAVVQLIGPHQQGDLNLTFIVDESSTAVEGTHFNLLTPGTFVLPAGSSFGYIRFEVLTDNVSADESFDINFTLTGGDIDVSENYKTLRHRLSFD